MALNKLLLSIHIHFVFTATRGYWIQKLDLGLHGFSKNAKNWPKWYKIVKHSHILYMFNRFTNFITLIINPTNFPFAIRYRFKYENISHLNVQCSYFMLKTIILTQFKIYSPPAFNVSIESYQFMNIPIFNMLTARCSHYALFIRLIDNILCIQQILALINNDAN